MARLDENCTTHTADDFYFSPSCGASICGTCELHAHLDRRGNITQELARCFCGWGMNPGEWLEDDVYDGDDFFEPDDWPE